VDQLFQIDAGVNVVRYEEGTSRSGVFRFFINAHALGDRLSCTGGFAKTVSSQSRCSSCACDRARCRPVRMRRVSDLVF